MKRIFLTGASAGIGLATARALTAAGHEVWGTSRHPERLPQLEHFHPVRLDLTNLADVGHAFANATHEAGAFDVVINNAGSGHFGPGELLTDEQMTAQFNVLFLGQVKLMQLALAQMQGRNSGLIINVTSLASRLPVPFMAAYNAIKAALAVFTMTVQLELGRSDVRMVDLQPADISTGFNDSVMRGPDDARYADRVAKTWKAVEKNMAEAPKPDLVANRIVKLIEEKNPPKRITVGGFFQAQIAPLIFRLLPQNVRVWGLKLYYGI